MTLLESYPERFGWRIWYAFPTLGRLITPVECIMLTGHTLDAHCDTSHTPPATDCTCGVYYWPSLQTTGELNRPPTTLPRPLAATLGVALGPIKPDPALPDALRTRRYRVLAMFLPEELAPQAHQFAMHHQVPVFPAITEATFNTAYATVIPNRGPDWFDQLDAASAPTPDRSVRRYNEAMFNERRHRRPFDAQLAAGIEAQFAAPRGTTLPQGGQRLPQRTAHSQIRTNGGRVLSRIRPPDRNGSRFSAHR